MVIDKELESKGFCKSKKSGTWYYQYSDFEILSFNVGPHTKVNGEECLKFDNIKIMDYFNDKIHMSINYDIYFDDINDFYDLLKSIGYKLR